jgi:glycosyltransferase involved in cell wall biosynthesis
MTDTPAFSLQRRERAPGTSDPCVSAGTVPRFSILVPTHNRAMLLARCLDSVYRQDFPHDRYEIIVIDDGSRDGTGALLAEQQKRAPVPLQVVSLPLRRGAGAARNQGFQRATGDIIVCIDDDCTAPTNWLAGICETWRKFPEAAAVGSVSNPTDTPLAWASYLLEFSAWLPVGTRCRYVNDIPACNIAYRRESIQGLRFRESLRDEVYEDSLFNYELRKRRQLIVFNPRISVCHWKWEQSYGWEDFLRSQQRYARGFLSGG